MSRLKNLVISLGSVIVDFEITKTAAPGEPSAVDAVALLQTTLADTTQTNPLTDNVAPVTQVVDTSVQETLQPLDANDEPVLGWFTQQEDQVGLADFFAFADEYNKTSSDPTYNADFDIAPDPADGVIELTDFFVFADNYGKIIANADEIRAAQE